MITDQPTLAYCAGRYSKQKSTFPNFFLSFGSIFNFLTVSIDICITRRFTLLRETYTLDSRLSGLVGKYTGLFINNLTLSKFYCKKTDDAIGTCSVSSDRLTSAPRSEGGAGKDHECSHIDLYGRPGESVWWTRIQNWRVQGDTRCSHWEFLGLKQNFESFCVQLYVTCLNCTSSILAIKVWKCYVIYE
jgi:hypothetical protein